ncbi:MAG: ComEC/Rec2 family competence protein [Parcubacteria group bacterium]
MGVFIIFLALSILLAEKIWNKSLSITIIFITLLLIVFALGSLRYAVKDFHVGEEYLQNNVEKKISMVGTVVGEPERREADTRFVIKTSLDKILVSTDMYEEVEYGDKVEVTGKLRKPGVFGEEGREFDYGKYLAKDDIYYTMSFAEVSLISKNEGNPLKASLLKIKGRFVGQMREILPEPESSLLAGLIIAGKDALPKNITEEFTRAGIVHIVVLSGFNITIIAEFIRRLFTFLTPKKAAVATIFSIILFVLMTGAGATIVRAALMAIIAVGGKVFGRNYSASRALLLAGFVMLLINPKILVFDPSFQLSFLATLALIYVVPVLDKYLERIPDKVGLRTAISTTTSTQILVLPFLVYSMGNVSLISLLTNVLVLPIIPLTMLIGFGATVLSFLSSLLALPLTYFTHILLSWILGVAHYLGNLSFAQVEISHFPFWLTLTVYLVIIFILVRSQSSLPRSAN